MAGWFVDIFIEWIVRMVVNSIRRIRSRSWRVATATVTSSRYERAGYGCHVADIHYDYLWAGEDFSGLHHEPFLVHDLGKDYVRRFPADSETPVRVDPANPSKSVLVRG